MTLDEFVGQGWNDHGADPQAVWNRLPEGIPLADTSLGIAQLANLATHVSGEHLGRWDDGLAFLDRLIDLPHFDPEKPEGKAVHRLGAVLHYCAGRPAETEARLARTQDPNRNPSSSRVRMLAVASSALAQHRRTEEAMAAFQEALSLASYGPDAGDPAAQALAITGNNLAAEMETRAELNDEEKALMLRAAEVGRKYWEIAGNWMNVERAEYRLAMSNLRAGREEHALRHAETCLRIVEENGTPAGELFFAQEALAKSHHALGQSEAAHSARDAASGVLASIEDEGFRQYCQGELAKLDAALAAV
ncbi:MAG: hypothetical protein R3E12_20590 [Candidatus Eisenbacteria bacterium]|uniref:Tetratricopeptide repeat protein n=1 Tax=Eiseniibacteriota bacterium TaxID=2212470 RepID=A0A956RQ87_UNCEI|nr:hypothetical protein [Candidatus Eisenbacteria bacterium]